MSHGRRLALSTGWVVILAALGAIGAWSHFAPSTTPSPPLWQVVSDEGGAIQSVACAATDGGGDQASGPEACRMADVLPKRIQMLFIGGNSPPLSAAVRDGEGRACLLPIPDRVIPTAWLQDPFLVLSDGKGSTLLVASATSTSGDPLGMAAVLAAYLRTQCRVSEMYFEGGNIVASNTCVFIGADTIARNVSRLRIDYGEVVARFERELGRKVVVLGRTPQPIAHIDLIVMPLDTRRIALGDVRLGAQVAQRALRDAPGEVASFERTCEELLSNTSGRRFVQPAASKPSAKLHVVGQTTKTAYPSRALSGYLDELGEQLEALGYQVCRIPFLLQSRETAPEGDRDKMLHISSVAFSRPDDPTAAYPCLTYTNVLTECFSGEMIVYLPQYGWPAMDRAAYDAWRGLGYRVVRVEGMAASALCGGALRCRVKVLLRGYGQPRIGVSRRDGRPSNRTAAGDSTSRCRWLPIEGQEFVVETAQRLSAAIAVQAGYSRFRSWSNVTNTSP